MNTITVTMPLKEYEGMKREIDRLKRESVRNYIDKNVHNLQMNDYSITINAAKIISFVNNEYPDHAEIYIKSNSNNTLNGADHEEHEQ